MINNGDAIGRLKALLHLRGAHKGSSRRERVAGDLFRLRGNMTDTRRVRVSRRNLPRLQGARELMPAVCPALRPRLREPWGKVPFRADRGNLAFRPVSERAPSVRPSEQSERVPSTRTPHQSERLASTRTPYNRNGLPPHSLPTS